MIYDVNYFKLFNTVFKKGAKTKDKLSFIRISNSEKNNSRKKTFSSQRKVSTIQNYIGFPPGLADDCTVNYLYRTYYDASGYLYLEEFEYVSHTCPSSGSSGGDGEGSGSAESGGFYGGNGIYYLPSIEDPDIADLNKYINCFSPTTTSNPIFKVKILVQEPDWQINSSSGLVNGVGHACIQLTKDNVTQVIGFYPAGAPFSQLFNQDVISTLKDNGGGDFYSTVSATYDLSSANFSNILSYLQSFNTNTYTYNLYTQNCVDFVKKVCAQGGIILPNTNASGPTDSSPAQLGADFRSMKLSGYNNISTNATYAPSSKGPCN